MKADYSPGPWTVAAESGEWFPTLLDYEPIPATKPNALLISAAPELLEALQAAMFYVPVETKARVLGDLAIDKALGYDKEKGYMP